MSKQEGELQLLFVTGWFFGSGCLDPKQVRYRAALRSELNLSRNFS
jgi:hypothetical protein